MSSTKRLTSEEFSRLGIMVKYTKTIYDNGIAKVSGHIFNIRTKQPIGVVNGNTKEEVKRNIKMRYSK